MKVTTDHKWKQFMGRHEVPQSILKGQFSHLSIVELYGFFRYRSYWYHINDFMRCDEHTPFKDWHGYASDSYFSGVLLKISSDGEWYMVGTYTS